MNGSFAKYWKGTVAVLNFAAVVITAFLTYFSDAVPPRVDAWITWIGVGIGAVLALMQEPNPLSKQEKTVIARMRLDALKQEERERDGQRRSRYRRWTRRRY